MQYLCRRNRLAQRQLDLCLVSQPPTVPPVGTLPDQTRRTLSDLLTRLLIMHVTGGCVELDETPEVDSDER
jgi:hypothetical protein